MQGIDIVFRPNWFIAFPLDGAFLARLPPPPARFRLFHEEDVHLTLAFLGGVAEATARRTFDELKARLVEQPIASMDVSLGALVPMGRSGAYTALSALLEIGREEAELLIGEQRHALTQAASGRSDRRKPKAHVTIARPERRATAEDRARGLEWARQIDIRDVRARLDRVALYTWHERRRERLFRIADEHALSAT